MRSIVTQRHVVRELLGFSGTNMRYVTITKIDVVQQRLGHRPERADVGEVRAAGRTT